MSYRRLWVLVQGLEPQARAQISEREWWSDEKAILVKIANQQSIGNWMFMQSKSPDAVPFPDLIRFPGQAEDESPPPPPKLKPSHRRYLDKVLAGHGNPHMDGAT